MINLSSLPGMADVLQNSCTNQHSPSLSASSVSLQSRYEVMFIIGNLPNLQAITATFSSGCEIHLLDPASDALAEIAGVLAGRTGISAIHIVSHGQAGELLLGSTTLSNTNINDYAQTLSKIGSSLLVGSDILLYGCNVGQGSDGQALVDSIARLTVADVAASSNLTGASASGGDWILEVQSGSIESNAIAVPMYSGVLLNHAPVVTVPSMLSFASKVEYVTGNGPMVITNADVNGDGNVDLITVSSNDNKVAVLLNNGNGTFASKVDYAVGNFPWSLTSADVNGDSKADLIAANWESSSVSVLINNGNGTFASKVDYGAGVNPIDVTSADVNADEKIDLIVANHYSSTISVLINNGNGTFHSKADYATGSSPNTITSADVNRDGQVDLITANSSTVSVFINNGNGTFASKVDYAMVGPYAVVTADVNGDGAPDMIVTNQVSNVVSVWINNGNGIFAAKVDYAVGRCPQSVTVADVNGDGKVDLIAANYYDTTVSVLTGNGNGTFASKVDYIVGSTPQSVTSADVNGDGKTDLIVANLSLATVSVLLNSSVASPTAFTEQTPVAVRNDIIINDVDGNTDWSGGKLKVQITSNAEFVDMLTLSISNPGGSGIWIDTAGNKVMAGSTEIGIANGAAVNWSTAWNFTFNASATNTLVQDVARAVTFYNSSDVPGTSDRTVTFTVTDSSAASASVMQTVTVTAVNDAPTAANKTLTTQEDTALTVSAADFGFSDVEGDSLAKVMITTLPTAGTFKYIDATVTLNQEINKADIDAGKLTFTPATNANGDAYATVGFKVSDGTDYSAAANTLTLHVTAVNDAPTISQPASILSFAGKVDYATGTQPFSVSSADLNGDGKLDLFIANCTDPGTVSVFINKGDGTFNTKVDYAAGSYPYSATSADVNGDGKADLIVTNTYSNPHTVSVLIGKGDGTFDTKVDYATGYQPKSVISADVNGDGKFDLITANYGTVSVLIGNGDGTFNTKVDYTTGYDSYCVTSADVNGDGKADLIVANQISNSNNISVLLNKGDGTFDPKVDYATAGYAYSVISADVNGDGKADLIVANFTANTISVLLNKGDGTFDFKVDYATGNYPYSLTSEDVNGDGKVDLITANNGGGNTVSVLLGNGDGTFNTKVDYTTGSNPHSVISVDVDSDGKVDLIVADNSPNQVSVLLNNSSVSSTTAFTEQTPVSVSGAIVINDIDGNADWNGGKLKVQETANNETSDTLSISTTANATEIWLDTNGNIIMAGSTPIGTADAASVSDGAAWNFTFNASATNALVQDVARAVTFNNSSNNPSALDRTVTFTAMDSQGAAASVAQKVSVMSVNDAPTSTDGSVTTNEDTVKLLSLADFGTYADPEGTALAKVQITTLESAGALQYHDGTSWTDVALNQEITATDITDGKLRFEPVANANGSAYATLGYKVSDGQLYSANAYTLTVNVTAVNDAPAVGTGLFAGSVTEIADHATGENTTNLVASGSFAISDVYKTNTQSVAFVAAGTGYLGTFTPTVTDQTTTDGTGTIGWNFTVADSAVDYLAAGQPLTQTYAVTVTDTAGATATKDVVVSIDGTNDAPVVDATDVTGTITEMVTPVGNLTDSGTIGFTDVDLADIHTVGVVTPSAGALGTLMPEITHDSTGTGLGGVVIWNYSVDASKVEYLAEGEHKVETFTFSVLDGHGGSVDRTVDVTITGTNEDTTAPTLTTSTPIDNATAVGVSDNIVLTFSEAVMAGTGNITISNGNGDTRIIDIANNQGQVSISGSTVTINPAADLNPGGSYNVQMASGVFKDLAGNAYAGISDATTLNFITSAKVSIDATLTTGSSFEVGDFNGDGLTDFVYGYGGSLAWYKNEGNGTFTNYTIGTWGSNSNPIVVDVNGDHKLDIVVAHGNIADSIAWYQNDGQGNFTRNVIWNSSEAWAVDAFDVDGDGDMDIIGASKSNSQVVLFMQNNGVFTQEAIDSTTARTLVHGDVNGDGYQDIIAGLYWSGQVVWYENNKNGGFIKHVVASVSYPHNILLLDSDGDGDKDLLVGNTGNGTGSAQYLLTNDGLQNFSQLDVLPYGWHVCFPESTAGNIDGIPGDEFLINKSDGLYIASVNPDKSFREKQMVSTTGYVYGDLADVDHDGHTDLVYMGADVGVNVIYSIDSPTLLSSTPSDNATAIAVSSDIVLTFSESIQRGTGVIEIHSASSTGAIVASYEVATSSSLTIAGHTLTINPTADLDHGMHYYVTLTDGVIKDLAGNSSVVATTYDFTTVAAAPVLHDLTGGVTFWKSGASITGVSSEIASVSAPLGTQLVEFRNIQVAADGARTIEIWETSTKNNIDSLQIELALPTGSTATWQDAAGLPAGWSSLANTGNSGEFLLAGVGLTPLSAGTVKLGTLALTAPTNPQHFDLLLRTGWLGNDTVPLFGITSDSMTTGSDGHYQHLEMLDGSYALTSAKVSGTAEGNAIKADDALAALKIAVGLNPNSDGSAISPYQYLAADVNKDGQIKAADALNILKMSVKLDTAPEKEWLFVPDSVGSEAMSRTHVVWPDNPIPLTLGVDQDLHLIGIVMGDVNGSWAA